jgi:hypothetical protein
VQQNNLVTIPLITFFLLTAVLAMCGQTREGPTDGSRATTPGRQGGILPTYHEVKRSELIVEDGEIRQVGSSLMVESGEMRAKIHGRLQRGASLDFTYLGPASNVSQLADGEIRHQFGLKLRAQDACNIVYVMWRFDVPAITVAIKRNLGKATHRECLDHGYTTVGKPTATGPIRPGEAHTLEAQLNDRILTVTADGGVVRTDDLGAEAMEFDGPVGLRSDNVRIRFNLLTVEE